MLEKQKPSFLTPTKSDQKKLATSWKESCATILKALLKRHSETPHFLTPTKSDQKNLLPRDTNRVLLS